MDVPSDLFSLDKGLFRDLNQAGTNIVLDVVMVAFAALGMSYILILAFFPLWLKGRKTSAIDIVVLVVLSDIISEGLKLFFERPRPAETLAGVRSLDWGFLTSASGFSFPSGHAVRAFSVGLYVFLAVRNPAVQTISLGTAVMICLSRVYLGLHFPSDVLGGALIGSVLALLVFRAGKKQSVYSRGKERVVSVIDTWLRNSRMRRNR